MNQSVVIASKDAWEAGVIAEVLSRKYSVQCVDDAAALVSAAEQAAAVVLDSNFSDAQAIDVLMEVLPQTSAPVIMLTGEDEPACAVEALRCGAASYLVKTALYAELLPTSVGDAIERLQTQSELKAALAELRRRNAAMEKELKELRIRASLGITGVMAASSKNGDAQARMEEIIAQRIESGTLQLPSYPRIATKLRELLQQDVGIAEVAQLLAQDAAVSAKLLRVANSAQFGNLRQVESVEGAVSRLGLAAASNLAEMIANRSLYASKHPGYRGLLEELWIHSIAVAHASVAIARQVGKAAPQSMFSLGLLHDSGRLALMQAVSHLDPEGKCIEGEENRKAFFVFLRKHNVNCGVVLMRRWGFGNDFVDAVRYNYRLKGLESPTRSVMIVNLANLLARAHGYGNALDSPDELENSRAKGFLFPGDSDLTPIVEDLHRAIDQTRSMLA